MRATKKDWLLAVLVVLLLMAVINWGVHASYGRLLREQWHTESNAKAKRLTDDLDNAYTRLEVFARCQVDNFVALSPEQINNPSLLKKSFWDSSLLDELGVMEVTVRPLGSGSAVEFYNRDSITPAKVWRGSLFDISKGAVPQSVFELTEYGPRLAVQLPFARKEGQWLLEVTLGLDETLTNFARREGCEAALLIPQRRWVWGPASPAVIKGAQKESFVIAAATHPRAAELLEQKGVQPFVGREAYGLFKGVRAHEAWGMLFLAGLEYQSTRVPVVGPTPSLVIWSDYASVIEQLNASRKGSLVALWLVGGIFGGMMGYYLLKLRRQSRRELSLSASALEQLNRSLQNEVTNRQRTEEKLRGIADQMYTARLSDEKLLSALAHQLKVTGSGIVGYAQLPTEGAEWDEAREEILRSGQRILLAAGNIDTWSRRAELAAGLEFHAMELAGAFEQSAKPFGVWMERKGVKLEVAIPRTVWFDGEPILFEALVRNILSNAIKYSPQGGTVTVGVRQLPAGVELSIADEGQGLSPLQMEKIFELPEHLLERGTAGEEGLGLGLKIAHWAATALHAQLQVFSGEGTGTRVTILFPSGGASRTA